MKFQFNKWPYNPEKPTTVEIEMALNDSQDMVFIKIDGHQLLTIHQSGGCILTAESCLCPLLTSLKNEGAK